MNKIMRKINFLYHRYIEEILFGNYLIPCFYNTFKKVKKKKRLDIGESVLVWNIDSLGDSTWITPVLKSLIKDPRKFKVTLVHNELCSVLFKGYENDLTLIGINPKKYYTPFGINDFKSLPLEKGMYDSMIVLEMGSRPADAGRLLGHHLGIKNISSTNLGCLKNICHYVAPENKDDSPEYWPKHFLKTLEPFDIEKGQAKIDLRLNQTKELDQVFIHPVVAGYGMSTKMLPLEKIKTLIEFILDKTDYDIVLSSGPGEERYIKNLIDMLNTKIDINRIKNVSGKLSIMDLLRVISESKAVICNDTSVLHFATNFDKPIITFFGATNENKIVDLDNDRISVFSTDLECRSCHKNSDYYPFWPKCKFESVKCLDDIDMNDVVDRLRDML